MVFGIVSTWVICFLLTTGKAHVNYDGVFPDSRFAVFGLGSSAYPNYCSFSMRVDELLSDIGLERLMEIHTGDEQKNQETAFRNWSRKIYSVCVSALLTVCLLFLIRINVTNEKMQ